MYLSDRERRFFLSGALPENLSPRKSFSFRDKGFLRKVLKSAPEGLPLQKKIIKQSLLLFQKHFRELFGNNQKGQKAQKPLAILKTTGLNFLSKRTITEQKVQKPQKNSEGGNAAFFPFSFATKTAAVYASQTNTNKIESKHSRDSKPFSKAVALPFVSRVIGEDNLLDHNPSSKEKKAKNLSSQFSGILYEEKKQTEPLTSMSNLLFQGGEFPPLLFSEKNQLQRKAFFCGSLKQKKNGNPRLLNYKNRYQKALTLKFQTKGLDSIFYRLKTKALPKASEIISETFRNQKRKGENFLLETLIGNCRYLYNYENLKACIVPQINAQTQKKQSKAKTLIIQRKKISLLYGQLKRKDIVEISLQASSIPGFFEEIFYTLLESRVDICIFRSGMAKTTAHARQLIRNRSITVNGQKVLSVKRRGKPGDYFSCTSKREIFQGYNYTTNFIYSLYLQKYEVPQRNCFYIEKLQKNLTLKEMGAKPQGTSFGGETGQKAPLTSIKTLPNNSPSYLFLEKMINLEGKKVNKGLYPLFFFEYLNKSRQTSSFDKDLAFLENGQNNDKIDQNRIKEKLWLNIKKHGQSSKDKTFGFKDKEKIYKNLYTINLLRNSLKIRKSRLTGYGKNRDEIDFLTKNLQKKHLLAVWGQKPSHLEISYKTGAFIYLYPPQKVVSSVLLDLKPYHNYI